MEQALLRTGAMLGLVAMLAVDQSRRNPLAG